MAKCRSCGYAVGEADRFCTNCGRRLPGGLLNEMRGWARAWPAWLSFGWMTGLFWVFGGGFWSVGPDTTVFEQVIGPALFAGLSLGGIKLARALGAWAVSGAGRAWFLRQIPWGVFWGVSWAAWFVLPGAEGTSDEGVPLWTVKLGVCVVLGLAGFGMWHLGLWIRRRYLEEEAEERARELDDGGA